MVLLLTSCAGPYTFEDSGATIELSEDDPFEIVLEGDATSDYSWQLVSENIYIKPQKPVTITTNSNKLIYTFDFKTKSDGTQKIVIVYSNGKEIKKSFQLNVIIGTIGLITSE